jgi:hypothetical protein
MYSPRWLFFYPGMLLIVLGLVGFAVALPGMSIQGVNFDAHTLLFSTLFILLGYQSTLFAVFAKTFAISEGLLPANRRMARLFEVKLETGLIVGVTAITIGLVLLLLAVQQWRLVHFGSLDYAHTMRWVIPGVGLTALGFQTVLSSFLISILGLRRR